VQGLRSAERPACSVLGVLAATEDNTTLGQVRREGDGIMTESYCINCGTTTDTPHCPVCITRFEETKAAGEKFYASPAGHLYCTDCGTPIPSGHVRCQPCFTSLTQ
jgi:hypothetical protein